MPIYKEVKNNINNKIYGCIGIDLYELDNSDLTFEKKFEESNKRYINEPLLILKEKINKTNLNFQVENYHFGLYEPNIFRRKILNYIHNLPEINVDPNDMKNSINKDLDFLYEKLYKKFVKLPLRELFSSFEFFNIIKNFDNNDEISNSYKKKLALKLLKVMRHEKFLQKYIKNEWDLYFNKINKKGNDGISPYKIYTILIIKKP